MKKEILGKCMLLMSALIWGSSFIVMKNAPALLGALHPIKQERSIL